ncbi:TIGR00730 family Rossman fold protein [Larsenimonas suaedae]|uniref:Cytokinin riboside 5'-monophosphate phosphoribohydrolase n=1 Tax=Larsenimonas suaedae TaxID=1851019 RepID=A0ABU1GX33_9GAMM|nr:TIGR00730 family Rossman fold protein [Larsenimonas suaedae]MCM2973174.1 TIGR00730 family Rossman fold protein [Larsenimonas suaedae]MDR5896611.1 TIGR00730 family Rossman fold protein [Larsenimonas suaedae]
MTSICVYLGSRNGNDEQWGALAEATGRAIAKRGWRLVYGGGRAGLMGRCADGALAAGGEVVGVIPEQLVAREMAHFGLTELHRVSNMHERKAMMADLADGFVTLPGGIGTLEELFETWTWRYLQLHNKPLGLVDQNAFFTPLLSFLDNAVAAGFLDASTRQALVAAETPEALLDNLFDTP